MATASGQAGGDTTNASKRLQKELMGLMMSGDDGISVLSLALPSLPRLLHFAFYLPRLPPSPSLLVCWKRYYSSSIVLSPRRGSRIP